MNTGEILIVLELALMLLLTLLKNGEQKEPSKYNFFAKLFASGITIWILYVAGLFHNV